MHLIETAWNKLRAALQQHAPPSVKRSLWNKEFVNGRWECLDSSAGDPIYSYIEKYSNYGKILDLGCGTGNTGNQLAMDSYSEYIGIDISDVAIEKAKMVAQRNGRAHKNRYFQSDIATYIPSGEFDVILFRESIYYIPKGKRKLLVERYLKCLRCNGVIIVSLWKATRFNGLTKMLDREFQVAEKRVLGTTAIVVLRRNPPLTGRQWLSSENPARTS